MARTVRIVGGFAAFGFLLPLLLLAYYTAMNRIGIYPNTDLLLYVCPSSIMSMALDKASVSTAVFVWLFISGSNAILYALPGIVIVLILRFRNRD